ncbi:hypothetical protein CCC_01964 [Paramagnetospirillum magnetotacticum MS-1]|uniref:Uncharacterized protein n=1 Tax=Paramagnetospirillum magnetotacticum MS-1 TaxID=272627 RepID=A0A0C2YFM4_PARME|nr:hypothetical protein CCC_01964 [Paramagnetospirillum magnetotacticum MS-1]
MDEKGHDDPVVAAVLPGKAPNLIPNRRTVQLRYVVFQPVNCMSPRMKLVVARKRGFIRMWRLEGRHSLY